MEDSTDRIIISENGIYLITGSATFLTFLFFFFVPLAPAYSPDLFFHRPEESVPAFFFAIALYGYYSKGAWKTDDFEYWLGLSLLIGFLSQSLFMSRSGVLFDFEFDAAHLIKKIIYLAVLIGLLISMFRLFRQVEIKTDQLAEKSEELKRSNLELQQFVYIASHDLKGPIRIMASYVDLIFEDYSEYFDDDGRELVTSIQSEAERMMGLIDDLLDLAPTGAQSVEDEWINIEETIMGVLSILPKSDYKNNVLITFDEYLLEVFAHRTLIASLLQNLVTNSIKYCSQEPLKIHVGSTTDRSHNNAYLQYYFKYDGIGIDSLYHEQIFQIFKRLHKQSDFEGSGIGLAICKKIVLKYGGKIWVESELGTGSIFNFTFPINLTR